MALATATVSGLVSGMDTATIIQQLMAIERRPIQKLQDQIDKANEQKSAFTSLNTALLALKTAADALSQTDTWNARTATVSDEDVLSASVTSLTPAGTYSFRVLRLAQAGQIASAGYADKDATPVSPAGGSFDITVGARTETITVDAADTLDDVAAAINAKNMGTSAVVVNTGQGSEPYRLILTSSQTGEANATVITNNTTGLWPRWLDSESYATPDSTPVGGGEFDLTANGSTAHVVIASGDSLQVAASKINAANPDVSAEVVSSSDGTYKLSITSAFADLAVTGNMSGLWHTAAPAVASGTALSSAQNALLQFGTGTPMEVESATNAVTGLAPGLTVDLKSVSAGLVSVTVASDPASILEQAGNFVSKYNAVTDLIAKYDSFTLSDTSGNNPDATGTAGPLFGNQTVEFLQQDLARAVGDSVAGVQAETNSLTMVGFKLGQKGKLTLDESVFNAALQNHADGVADLFSAVMNRAAGRAVSGPAAGQGSLASLTNGIADADKFPADDGYESAADVGAGQQFTIDFGAARSINQLVLQTFADATGVSDFSFALQRTGTAGFETVKTVSGLTGANSVFLLDQPMSATAMQVTVTGVRAGAGDKVRLLELKANEEAGAAHRIGNLLGFVTSSLDGGIATEQGALDTKIATLQDSIDKLNDRADAKEERLQKEFAAMEQAMSQLQSQSSFFLSQLSNSSSK